MALPVTSVGVFLGLLPSFSLSSVIGSIAISLAFIAFIISIVGYFVMLYIVNLRLDVILYARAVNGIRKYFYDRGPFDLSYKLRMRVLPQSPSQPAYLEHSYFAPVIATFAFFNSTYLVISLTLPKFASSPEGFSFLAIPLWALATGTIFGLLHYGSYRLYSHHREHGYLKSFILGVDIDGVLNTHRSQFSNKLRELTGKIVESDWMTTIPLHNDPSIGVSRPDEKQVFNDPDYWISMPDVPDAKDVIDKLRHQFKLKIHIFTYRPWPTYPVVPGTEPFKRWQEAAVKDIQDLHSGFIERFLLLRYFYQKAILFRLKHGWRKIGLQPIQVLTQHWLKLKGINYDNFTLERGNEDVADPEGNFRNRFNISREKKIRFFVEDDADKASKLAFICDVVFLINQPYNTWKPVPNNVVRVGSWDEISKLIKNFL